MIQICASLQILNVMTSQPSTVSSLKDLLHHSVIQLEEMGNQGKGLHPDKHQMDPIRDLLVHLSDLTNQGHHLKDKQIQGSQQTIHMHLEIVRILLSQILSLLHHLPYHWLPALAVRKSLSAKTQTTFAKLKIQNVETSHLSIVEETGNLLKGQGHNQHNPHLNNLTQDQILQSNKDLIHKKCNQNLNLRKNKAHA